MSFDPNTIARKSVLNLKAYSSARDEFQGTARVFLDANENAYGSPLVDDFSRYPDPVQNELRFRISELLSVDSENIFVGNGSDEIIDLLIRVFCEPEQDSILVCPPTYGMYKVSAATSAVEIVEVPLNKDFQPNRNALKKAANEGTKLLFLCSPNNPTGNLVNSDLISQIAEEFNGIVVVDEAYIEFSGTNGFLNRLVQHPNVLVMRTLSKAWGLAGLRIGLGFASEELLGLLRKIKPPYNVSEAAQQLALNALMNFDEYVENLDLLIKERERLSTELSRLTLVEEVFPSDANFLLTRFRDSQVVFNTLRDNGVIVRDRSRIPGCERCLRITVGTEKENDTLLEVLEKMQ